MNQTQKPQTQKTPEHSQTVKHMTNCLAVLSWQRTSMGARRYDLLLDMKGQVVKMFEFRLKGPRYSGQYVSVVEPGKNYYLLFLHLTNIREKLSGPQQNKYGKLEIVRFTPVGQVKDYIDVRWWPARIADYMLCKSDVVKTVWRYDPWHIKKDYLEEWQNLPTTLIWAINMFERSVEYWEDLDLLVRVLKSNPT